MNLTEYDYLCHYGVLGMKWGVRRYQNYDGSLTNAGRRHYGGGDERDAETVLKKGTTLQTLSVDPDRTKNSEFFYSAYTDNDKRYYKAMFSLNCNKKVAGIVPTCKLNITNKAAKDMKVASETTGKKVIEEMYNKDKDFREFVNDPNRMNKIMRHDKKFKAYVDALKTLDGINEKGEASSEEIHDVYKIFNYILPNDGAGDAAVGADVANQRKKFFNKLKKSGYSAVLDTNDAYYGGYRSNVEAPVIVFDMNKIVLDSVKKTKYSEVLSSAAVSSAKYAHRAISGKYV